MQQESNTNSLALPLSFSPGLPLALSPTYPLPALLLQCLSVAPWTHTHSLVLSFQFPAENPLFPISFYQSKSLSPGAFWSLFLFFFFPLPFPIVKYFSSLKLFGVALHHLEIPFASLMWCFLFLFFPSQLHFSLYAFILWLPSASLPSWEGLLLITKVLKIQNRTWSEII